MLEHQQNAHQTTKSNSDSSATIKNSQDILKLRQFTLATFQKTPQKKSSLVTKIHENR